MLRSMLDVRHWPLRLRVVFLMIVSSIVPLAIVGYMEYLFARDFVQKNTASLLAARGDGVKGQVDALNDRYLRSARRIAEAVDVARYLYAAPGERERAMADARELLALWQRTDTDIRGVALLDPAGMVLLATEPALEGRNLSAHHSVLEARKGVPVIADLHISEIETGSVPTLGYLAPVRDAQRSLGGVVAVWVRADALWQLITAGNEKAGPESFSTLVDQSGVLIAHSAEPDAVFHPLGQLPQNTVDAMVAERRFGEQTRQLLQQQRAFPDQFQRAQAAAPDSAPFRGFSPISQQWTLGVARRLETAPWTLFYMIPERSLEAPLRQSTLRVAVTIGGFMALALLAGLFASRGIVSSVKLVSDVSEKLNGCAVELTAQVAQIAASVTETATAVSQTTSTVEEVKQTALLTTEKAREVSDSAQRTMEISQGGKRSVEEWIESMQQMQEHMESTAETIVRLSEQSQTIGEIIASVNDLAEQSNLLAVNAAIEAAKAGEQGKGFAVVAQEVKSLAGQSKQATAQVRGILGEIQRATAAAVQAAEQGSRTVEGSVRRSADVAESIRVLASYLEGAAQAATQIAVSAQQQLIGMDQVALAMRNINDASAQNATSTRDTESAAHNLQSLGGQLKQLAEQYRA